MVMGNEDPLLTCMVVEVVGTVDWALLAEPGRVATVNVGFRVSCGKKPKGLVRRSPARVKILKTCSKLEI